MSKTITGVVSSKKTDKTIVVTEHVRLTHPLYRKQYTVTKKFMAHDENNEAQEGDKVVISETRPISARKHFTLDRIVEKAGITHKESDTPLEVVQSASPATDDAATEEK
jgi:small subunit ribosomal protein S17